MYFTIFFGQCLFPLVYNIVGSMNYEHTITTFFCKLMLISIALLSIKLFSCYGCTDQSVHTEFIGCPQYVLAAICIIMPLNLSVHP